MLVRLAFHQLDPVVDQVGVEVFDLLLRELDVFDPTGDLVVVEDAILETLLNELLQFLDFRKGDFDGEQRRLTSRLREGGRGLDRPLAREEPVHASPGSPSRRPDITEVAEKAKSDFLKGPY
jgi:hypothetical protein